MVMTHFTGPLISSGAVGGSNGGTSTSNQDAGPNVAYQGEAIFDPRYGFNKDNVLNGTIRCSYLSTGFVSCDAVPSTLSATNIATAAAPTSGTAMSLAGASSGIATNVPFLPFQSSAVLTANIALDFGFDTMNCTGANPVVTVANSAIYWIGMPVVVANVGNSGATAALLTYVTAIPSATTVTLNAAPAATNSAAPVGTGNSWGPTGLAGATLTPSWYQPYVAAGADLIYDPTQGISRGVRIVTTQTAATGGTFTVTGYTNYGELQTQLLTHPGNVATIWSKKTFKFIQSVVPNFTDTATYSVGTSDVFGFAFRNDKWEYDNFFWAGASISTSNGWTKADTTSPATNGSGDVRGTIQIGTNGPSTTGATGGSSNGTLRIYLQLDMPAYNMIRATPSAPQPMYGVTPA